MTIDCRVTDLLGEKAMEVVPSSVVDDSKVADLATDERLLARLAAELAAWAAKRC